MIERDAGPIERDVGRPPDRRALADRRGMADRRAALDSRADRDLFEGELEGRRGLGLPFRVRLMVALIATAVLPLAAFGLVVVVVEPTTQQPTLTGVLLLGIALAALGGVLIAYLIAADLTTPLRALAAAVDRVSRGDLSQPIVVTGDDELARLAESYNRLAADAERRNRQLAAILGAIAAYSPRDGVDWLVGRGGADAKDAFQMIEARVLLVDPSHIPVPEDVPGDPRPVRAEIRVGGERLGLVVGRLAATRTWERADQDLLELFAHELGVAIRNAELFAQVEAQNAQLLELDEAKDDFLRGVSHNLQTPLARIRAYADQLAAAQPDRRLGIIAEQSDRLSRMVRQLLTVSRLEAGTVRPLGDVIALGPRARRTWEALAAGSVELTIADDAQGWLTIADPDALDQVLWALLDNAVKYGQGGPVSVVVSVEPAERRLRMTVTDRGPGIPEGDRPRLFGRFARGAGRRAEDGSGLGLYVSRELCRAMGGDLVLEPSAPGRGAAFSLVLPAEPPEES